MCTVSCWPVTGLSISRVSSPTPGSVPRARALSLRGPSSLCPNCIKRTSPALRMARVASQFPPVRNVLLLRPPSAPLITGIGAIISVSGSPQPHWPLLPSPRPLRTVESPISTTPARRYGSTAAPLAERKAPMRLPGSALSPATTAAALNSAPSGLVCVSSPGNNARTFASPMRSYPSATMAVASTNGTPVARAIPAAHSSIRPDSRSTLPSFQTLRTVRERTIGVAPFERASATIRRIYQP